MPTYETGRRGVFVLGMHRSGTSATTRVLNLLGIPLRSAEDALPHTVGNERGHWESRSLMQFNELLLRELGARWNDLPPLNAPVCTQLSHFEGDALTAFRHAHPTLTWAWKDPRLCLLLPFWRKVIPEPHAVVLVVRDPLEIATSLAARDGETLSATLRQWELNLNHALVGCGGAATFVVHYHDLLEAPVSVCAALVSFLDDFGMDVARADEQVQSFLSPQLRHSHCDARSSPLLTPSQRRLLERLNQLGGGHSSFDWPVEQPALEDQTRGWADWFRRATNLGCAEADIRTAAAAAGLTASAIESGIRSATMIKAVEREDRRTTVGQLPSEIPSTSAAVESEATEERSAAIHATADAEASSVLICALPRTGSWLMCEALDLTELAGRPEEYFRPDYLALYLRQWGAPAGAPIAEYTQLCIEATSSDNGVFSAKLHWYQMNWLIQQLRSISRRRDVPAHELVGRQFPNVRYVHLARNDHARQALSWYRAIKTDRWFQIDGSASPHGELEPDYQQVRWLEDLIDEHHAAWNDYFALAGVEPLRISYEQLVGDRERTVRRVMDELGVGLPNSYRLPHGRMRKQADGRSEDWLAKYLAVREGLMPRDIGVTWSAPQRRFATHESGE